MHKAPTASAFLRRLNPWLGKAVHTNWKHRRSFYQDEVASLLVALAGERGHMPHELGLRLEGLLGKLYREWFPRTWRRNPTYQEVLADFRWWLAMAERWSQPPERPARRRSRVVNEPRVDQPKRLLRLLGLTPECSERHFLAVWRRFLKANHPDLNPDQTPEERRRFAEAVALWRR